MKLYQVKQILKANLSVLQISFGTNLKYVQTLVVLNWAAISQSKSTMIEGFVYQCERSSF